MTTTRTGSIPIGVRQLGGWQQDIDAIVAWAAQNAFACIDVRALPPDELKKVTASGLKIGSVDLPQPWSDLASADAAKRKDAAQKTADYVRQAVATGASKFFVVLIPEDHAAPRSENLARTADGYGQLCEAIADTGARICLEGWPGPDPYIPSLACTPESYRAVFDAVGSDVLGVNFDPSHLIRMGIDHVRFCQEFVQRIYHVHGKDTELLDEERYQYGHEQPATLARPYGFGAHAWRYTIPGHGITRWHKLLTILQEAGYDGLIGIELEDCNFNGSEEGEKQGFLASRDFLKYV